MIWGPGWRNTKKCHFFDFFCAFFDDFFKIFWNFAGVVRRGKNSKKSKNLKNVKIHPITYPENYSDMNLPSEKQIFALFEISGVWDTPHPLFTRFAIYIYIYIYGRKSLRGWGLYALHVHIFQFWLLEHEKPPWQA